LKFVSCFDVIYSISLLEISLRLLLSLTSLRCRQFRHSHTGFRFTSSVRNFASWNFFTLVAVIDFTSLSSISPLAYRISFHFIRTKFRLLKFASRLQVIHYILLFAKFSFIISALLRRFLTSFVQPTQISKKRGRYALLSGIKNSWKYEKDNYI